LVPRAWVLSRYDDVVMIDRDERRFSSEEGATLRLVDMTTRRNSDRPVMMSLDGPDHVRNRRVASRGLKPAMIRELEPRVRELSDELADAALARGRVEWMSEVASQLPLRVICELVGIPEADRETFHESVETIGNATNPNFVTDPMQVVEAARCVWAYASELAEAKRACPAGDLMSRVVAAHDSEQLTKNELEAMLLMLGLGGDETTRNALGHGIFAFSNFPDQWDLLCSDPERYVNTAVEEVLRWATPVIGVRRTVTEDLVLHDQQIKAGDVVYILYASANFDPSIFDRPYEFDITRRPNNHLTFGTGPHVCLGAAVARLEIRTLLLSLAERVEKFITTDGISYAYDSFLRPVRRLEVELHPRELATARR
jgi:cytochrome P450